MGKFFAMNWSKQWPLLIPLVLALAMLSCAIAPPARLDDACAMMEDRPRWYEATRDSYELWGVNPAVQLAIIRHESGFRSDAKPRRKKILGFIPGARPTTAFGYAQALDGTWEWYRNQTGNSGADRDNFADATDFIGWYTSYSQQRLGIDKNDAFSQYLAYHEGHTGYEKQSFNSKPWLIKVARRVEATAVRYQSQLSGCTA